MVRVTVRRITVGQSLRHSKHFSSGVGLGGEAMEAHFLLLMLTTQVLVERNYRAASSDQ